MLLTSAFAGSSAGQTQQESSTVRPREPRYFVGAAVLMDKGRYQAAFPVEWRPGVAIDAGWFLATRRSLRVSGQMRAWGARDFDRIESVDEGPAFTTSTSRTVVGDVVLGLHHLTGRRFRVASLWGLSAYKTSEQVDTYAQRTGRRMFGGTLDSWSPGGVVGLEAAWATSPRTEVVAQLMGHAWLFPWYLNDMTSVTHKLTFRWRL